LDIVTSVEPDGVRVAGLRVEIAAFFYDGREGE